MPKVVKYGRWRPSNIERALEAIQIGHAGLTAAPHAYLFQELPKETFRLVLWVHVTTLPTKSQTATCQIKSRAAGFSKDRVSELFYLLEITVEHKLNTARIYVHKVYGNVILKFQNKTGEVTWRNGTSQIWPLSSAKRGTNTAAV
jgi:hypothetical protein